MSVNGGVQLKVGAGRLHIDLRRDEGLVAQLFSVVAIDGERRGRDRERALDGGAEIENGGVVGRVRGVGLGGDLRPERLADADRHLYGFGVDCHGFTSFTDSKF